MSWYIRAAFGLAVCSACITSVVGQEPPPKPKAKVELRWVERNRVEGLTEERGFPSSCALNSDVFPHKKPALVITAADVAEARLTNLDLSRNGLSSENYMVTLHFTKEFRDKLATACGEKEERLLTVKVDSKYWGWQHYDKRKDKKLVPAQVRAETFVAEIGYFSSKAEAERVVDAFK